jgi:hypothetical protein
MTIMCAIMRRGFLTLAAIFLTAAAPAWAQSGFDRPGGDYLSFQVRSGDPAECAGRCDRDGRCRAWSFVYPNPAAQGAVCWLKRRVPKRVQSTCCVSGVRGSGVVEPQKRNVEYGIDRFGGDLRALDVEVDANGETCAKACTDEKACRAWTYVRPGYAGGAARCYLKGRITPPRKKPCCISGVVR